MFGKKTALLTGQIQLLAAQLREAQRRVDIAEDGEKKAHEAKDKAQATEARITEEHDKLLKLVRKQTDNDLAMEALRILGIIPTKETTPNIETLMQQRDMVAQQNTALQSSLGGSMYPSLGGSGWGFAFGTAGIRQ